MSRPLLVVLALALFAAAAAWWLLGRDRHASRPPSESYSDRLVHQQRRAAQIDGAVVFIGDSHVEGLATSRITAASENFGIGGDTLPGVTGRIRALPLGQARAVVVLAGFNDQPDFPDFDRRYTELLAAIPQPVPVVAVGLVPIDPFRRPELAAYNGRRPALNASIRQACAGRAGCRYVAPPFVEALAPSEHVGDGLHLSAGGYRLLSDAIRGALPEPARSTNGG